MILYLPGYSARNQQELELFQSAFDSKGLQAYCHQWAHWQGGNHFDVANELQLINKNINVSSIDTIFTKSIGGLVAMHLINEYSLQPNLLVIMGAGVTDLAEADLDFYRKVLSSLSETQVYFIYNTADPHGTAAQMEVQLGENNYTFIEREAADHKYPYADEVILRTQNEMTPTSEQARPRNGY